MRKPRQFSSKLGQHISHKLVYGKSREELVKLDPVDEALNFLLDFYLGDRWGEWNKLVGGEVYWGVLVEDVAKEMHDRIPKAHHKWANRIHDKSPKHVTGVDVDAFWHGAFNEQSRL